VRERIQRFYGRESLVVYPPVDTERLTPGPSVAGEFDLIVSALVPYKRIDLAVRAYSRMGFPLLIVGVGGQVAALKAAAGPNVRFLGWKPDHEVLDLYRRCRMLVFPGEEDFGLVPLEAQACGKPVVAYGHGGAVETVCHGTTGLLFPEQTESALLDAVARCASLPWDAGAIRAHAERFGVRRFIDGMAQCVDACRRGTAASG
jgi:glycosyltransferase involved in cell wall biosynthesis